MKTAPRYTWPFVWFSVLLLTPFHAAAEPEFWLTDPAGSARFEKQVDGPAFESRAASSSEIVIDPGTTYQTIDGFGYSLNHQPHTPGGCTRCLGAVTIDGDKVTRNTAYYVIAHASKAVRPGSVRIASNLMEGLPNVAFKTPHNRMVLIVLNDSPLRRTFQIRVEAKVAAATLPAGAVGTYVWP